MRRKMSENNIFPNFDLYNEYRKIEYGLSEKRTVYAYGNNISIENLLEEYCFNDWNLRGTFFSVNEMRDALGIAKEKAFPVNALREDTVLDFLQYSMNCVFRVVYFIKIQKERHYFSWIDKSFVNALIENMKQLIFKLNCIYEIDEKTDEIFINYNDNIASVVSQDYPDISNSISEYRRIDNRGDLQRKAEILCTLYKKLESVENKLKANNFKDIVNDATFLFDKTGIRHWKDEDKLSSQTFLKMEANELEGWYDRTFNLFLSCMVIATYIDNKDDIKEIKKQ